MTVPALANSGSPSPARPASLNAITEVPGVGVGLTTILEDARPGVHRGLCTGVTAILPRLGATELRPVWAGLHCFNGNGELTGATGSATADGSWVRCC
jgi:L-aminopeptidase/D-esterase-like protein